YENKNRSLLTLDQLVDFFGSPKLRHAQSCHLILKLISQDIVHHVLHLIKVLNLTPYNIRKLNENRKGSGSQLAKTHRKPLKNEVDRTLEAASVFIRLTEQFRQNVDNNLVNNFRKEGITMLTDLKRVTSPS